jgi:hypothetical protein
MKGSVRIELVSERVIWRNAFAVVDDNGDFREIVCDDVTGFSWLRMGFSSGLL